MSSDDEESYTPEKRIKMKMPTNSVTVNSKHGKMGIVKRPIVTARNFQTTKRPRSKDKGESSSSRETLQEIVTNISSEQVCLIIGPEKDVFIEYKALFSTNSDVFHAMFFGGLKENDPVFIPDVETDVFRMLLKYLKKEEFAFESMEQAYCLCNVAEKYDLPVLKQKCAEFLFPLEIDDLWLALNCGCLFDIPMLLEASMEIVEKKTSQVLFSPQFPSLSRKAVLLIVANTHLDVSSEMEVLNAVINWAKHQCANSDKTMTRENLREELGDILNHIRFLNMTPKEITKLSHYLLTADEAYKLIKVIEKQADSDTIKPLCFDNETVRHKLTRAFPVFKTPIQHIMFPSTNQPGEAPVPLEFSSAEVKTMHIKFRFGENIEILSVYVPSRTRKNRDESRFYFEDLMLTLGYHNPPCAKRGFFRGRVAYNDKIEIPLFDEENPNIECVQCLSDEQASISAMPHSENDSSSHYSVCSSPMYRPVSPVYTIPPVTVNIFFNRPDAGYYPWNSMTGSSAKIILNETELCFISGFSYYVKS